MARFAAQPRAIALRTGLRVEVLGQLLAHHHRIGLAIAPLEVRNDAFERVFARHRLAAIGEILERDLFLVAAVQDHLLDLFRQLGERLVEIEAEVLGQALQHLEIELVPAIPSLDRARGQRELRERDHALGIEKTDRSESIAARTGTHRIVEREQPRLELGERVAADRARELGRIEMLDAGVHFHGDGAAVAVAQRGLERFREALLEVGPDAQAIDHDFDRVLLVLGHFRQRVDLVDLAVDADAHETLGAQLGEQVRLLALPVDHDRGEDHELGLLRQHQHGVDHLRDGHRHELLLGVIRAIRLADPREKQPQVVVDLGHRSHGRARVVRGRLLLDGNCRRQPLDQVDVGLLHELKKLPCIRRQRFDVAALTLGVERVERQRALARAGQPGDDDQPVTRQIEIDVLEIVRSRAANADVFHGAPAKRAARKKDVADRTRWGQRRRGQPANILLSSSRF